MSGRPAFYWKKQSTTATYTASDTLTGTDPENVKYATEDNGWKPEIIVGSKSIIIDNQTAASFDTICLLGNDMDGVLLNIFASTDNFVSSNVAILIGHTISAQINAAIAGWTSASYRYWKIAFQGMSSAMEINHIALDLQVLLPFFVTDPDEDGLDPTAEHLVSKAGLYLGTAQDKTERNMPLDFGEVTPAEKVNLQAWADANIETVNPFFLQVDSDVERVHFGRLEGGGSWHAPLEPGVNIVRTNTFTTRAK